MNVPQHLPADVAAIWLEVVTDHDDPDFIVGHELEAYCGAVARLRDAQRRISEEGMIVPDGKQNPIPHPALAIERASMEQLRKWGDKFRG